MTFEQEQGPKYAEELDKIVNMLQIVHPVGEVKSFGRLEAAAALADILKEHCQMSDNLTLVRLHILTSLLKMAQAIKLTPGDVGETEALQEVLLRME